MKSIFAEVEPRAYERKIYPWQLTKAFMIAYLGRLSSLEVLLAHCGSFLPTRHKGPLSYAVKRVSSLKFVQCLVEKLQCDHKPGNEELVVLDGMALTIPKTRRHGCKKFNHKTVGGGVIWAYMVEATKGVCPVKVIQIIEGAWADSKIMQSISLIPKGPVYVMDRGFYALALVQKWLHEKVRFVVRAKKSELKYVVKKILSKPRRIGHIDILLDAKVVLGGQSAKAHPHVRLVWARLSGGEDLILVTDRFRWSVGRILQAYRKRYHIERFHQFLKDKLGLAHLYSFNQTGMNFLLYTALLMAMLLFFVAEKATGETIQILQAMLRALRRILGLTGTWKRNIATKRRAKQKPKAQDAKTLER
jgi:hypothetical protein